MTLRRTCIIAGALLLLSACNNGTPATEDPAADQGATLNDVMQESSSSAATETSEPTENGAPVEPRIIDVDVESWSFSPSTIRLKKGERVTLRLTGGSGTHGFAVPSLGINQSVSAGQTAEVTVPTDVIGVHNFFCSIPCGEGHRDMTGAIIVEE